MKNIFRESTEKEVLDSVGKVKDYMLEFPTGFGKTKIAIELAEKLGVDNVLIVIPMLVLEDGWRKEINKWGTRKINYTFVTYKSLENKIGNWKVVIFDECHHLSERCCDLINTSFNIEHSLLLSATVNKEVRERIFEVMECTRFKVNTLTAIDNGVIPEPKVYAIGINLDNITRNQTIIKRPSKTKIISVEYPDRFKAFKNKNARIEVSCTQYEYNDYMSKNIDYAKRMFIMNPNNAFRKNHYLQLCGQRLRWLASQKTDVCKKILDIIKDKRTLTFCTDIKQTEEFGENCINSKNKESKECLDKFNKGLINHISACKSLNEGVNLTNCKVGLFASLSASNLMTVQRIGRILRDKNPVIIIPYFRDTRDEDLVLKMSVNFKKVELLTEEDMRIHLNTI